MLFPNVIVISGNNYHNVVKMLKDFNIKYKIHSKSWQDKPCKILVNAVLSGNKLFYSEHEHFYIEDLYKGMHLSLFKSTPIKLFNLNPEDWTSKIWEPMFEDDVKQWDLKIPETMLTAVEKLAVASIIHDCIGEEKEVLKMYKESLLPVFQHPEVLTMLQWCIARKEYHVNLWLYIKKKFRLATINIEPYIRIRQGTNNLCKSALNLVEIITLEEPLKTSALECLTHFTEKNQLIQIVEAITHRNQESYENSETIRLILDKFEELYPFLSETINTSFRTMRFRENFRQENFFELDNLQMFSKGTFVTLD